MVYLLPPTVTVNAGVLPVSDVAIVHPVAGSQSIQIQILVAEEDHHFAGDHFENSAEK